MMSFYSFKMIEWAAELLETVLAWCEMPAVRLRKDAVKVFIHYNDVIMSTMAFQFTSLTIVRSTVYWGADQRKHQSSTSLAPVQGIHRWPVNSPHNGPVTRKMFPFDDVTMQNDSAQRPMDQCMESVHNMAKWAKEPRDRGTIKGQSSL